MPSVRDAFEQFLVRDLLGYVMPGMIAATAVGFCAPVADVDHAVTQSSLAKLGIVAFLASYLCGFACSAVGDAAGCLWRRVRPQPRAKAGEAVAAARATTTAYGNLSMDQEVAAFGGAAARRYVVRLQDLGLLTCNASVALLALVAARWLAAHPSYATAAGMGPFAIAYRCMTPPVTGVLLLAAAALLWWGRWCLADAAQRLLVVAHHRQQAQQSVARGR